MKSNQIKCKECQKGLIKADGFPHVLGFCPSCNGTGYVKGKEKCKCHTNPLNEKLGKVEYCSKCIKRHCSPLSKQSWEERILKLSELEDSSSKDKIMAFPWDCHVNDGTQHNCLKGYVCHCDDGFLCEHRAKWLIEFISTLLLEKEKEIREKIEGMFKERNAFGWGVMPEEKLEGYNQAINDILALLSERKGKDG